MGADLYIREINQPLQEKYQPLFEAAVRRRDALPPKSRQRGTLQKEVTKYYDLMYSDGYFRDSYNSTCVMATLGLSWWADVIPLCTNGHLRGKNLHLFRSMVAKAKQRLPSKEELRAGHAKVDDKGPNSIEEWDKYFVEKRTQLLAFLDKAIELETAIDCSL